jgi:hypothetical protein
MCGAYLNLDFLHAMTTSAILNPPPFHQILIMLDKMIAIDKQCNLLLVQDEDFFNKAKSARHRTLDKDKLSHAMNLMIIVS